MSNHDSPAEIKKSVRRYLLVFCALIFGTVFTVAVSYYPFQSVAVTVAVALLVASVKGFLVAGYFMHLISEKKMIYTVLAFTVFLAAALMWLTLYAMHDFPAGTTH